MHDDGLACARVHARAFSRYLSLRFSFSYLAVASRVHSGALRSLAHIKAHKSILRPASVNVAMARIFTIDCFCLTRHTRRTLDFIQRKRITV